MAERLPQCQNFKKQVDTILELLRQEASLSSCDVNPTQTSLRKAISPKFEIVFAGGFSAGKSMLINALLERELLYSAEGHATGTECKIEYAHPEDEKVVLTFLSKAEVREQVFCLCENLGLHKVENIDREDAINLLSQGCEAIILSEGGESKSERAKQAKALTGFALKGRRQEAVGRRKNYTFPFHHAGLIPHPLYVVLVQLELKCPSEPFLPSAICPLPSFFKPASMGDMTNDFRHHIAMEVNQVVTSACEKFEADFQGLRARMIHRLDELLDTFSVADTYKRATLSHPRNGTAPLIAILVEAIYYLANQLEDILVESSEKIVANFFQRLNDRIPKAEYYKEFYRLLGDDGGLEEDLHKLEKQVSLALKNAARVECDRFVRESPRFYDEGTFSIYQFRQTLQQTSQAYDCESMVEAQSAIRQLLKLDFEPKVSETIGKTFRQIINQSFKTQLLPMAEIKSHGILQQYAKARAPVREYFG